MKAINYLGIDTTWMTPLQRFIAKRVSRIRYHLYKRGIRPKVGSIWYSPSLDLNYSLMNNKKH